MDWFSKWHSLACHAGGRGFERRLSRHWLTCDLHLAVGRSQISFGQQKAAHGGGFYDVLNEREL